MFSVSWLQTGFWYPRTSIIHTLSIPTNILLLMMYYMSRYMDAFPEDTRRLCWTIFLYERVRFGASMINSRAVFTTFSKSYFSYLYYTYYGVCTCVLGLENIFSRCPGPSKDCGVRTLNAGNADMNFVVFVA